MNQQNAPLNQKGRRSIDEAFIALLRYHDPRVETYDGVRKGLRLIDLLVAVNAPENKRIPMVAATAMKMPTALAAQFLEYAERFRLISKLGKDYCLEACKINPVAAPGPIH